MEGSACSLKLTLAKDSRLSIDDSKQIISYLAGLGGFKLAVKSQPKTGIQLFVSLEASNVESFKKQLFIVNPDMLIETVKNSSLAPDIKSLSLNYRFNRHYAYPLLDPEKAASANQTGLIGQISSLSKGQAVNITISACKIRPLKAQLLKRRLLNGASPRLSRPGALGRVETLSHGLLIASVAILRSVLQIIENLSHANSPSAPRPKAQKITNSRNVALLDKLYEPLFKTNLTVNVSASNRLSAHQLAKDVTSGLNDLAENVGYQRFKISSKPKLDIYSASDLAALFNIPKVLGIYDSAEFKALSAPRQLIAPKQRGSVTLGINNYQGIKTKLTLNKDSRYRHLYITGATGSGKSTLMANLIIQDLKSNQGLTLIDPHGDLAREVMAHIPVGRLGDVIHFDPYDQSSKVSLNLLELKSKPGSPQYLKEKDQVTESLISLLKKVFGSEDLNSHRIEYILRNSIQTALLIEGSTIFTIYQLLTDKSYRLKILPYIKDQNLANFWKNELGQAGDYQRVKMTAGITSKIGRFLFSEPSKRVFGQAHSTLDFSQLMDKRKILICNFSKGQLGEDGSKLFGATVLTKLQLSALSRASKAKNQRSDHYLYVDEFQNYSPNIFVQLLSEARKYGLYITAAEQSPSQQDPLTTNIILANIGNLLCFRSSSPRDEHLLLPYFLKYLNSDDLNNLPAYNFYFKSVGEQVIPPTSGRVVPLKTSSRLNHRAVDQPETKAIARPARLAI